MIRNQSIELICKFTFAPCQRCPANRYANEQHRLNRVYISSFQLVSARFSSFQLVSTRFSSFSVDNRTLSPVSGVFTTHLPSLIDSIQPDWPSNARQLQTKSNRPTVQSISFLSFSHFFLLLQLLNQQHRVVIPTDNIKPIID